VVTRKQVNGEVEVGKGILKYFDFVGKSVYMFVITHKLRTLETGDYPVIS
jgi:hypothetical protein